MTYTSTPIPTLDTINYHGGLVFVASIMFLFFVMFFLIMFVCFNNDEEYNIYKVFVLCCIPVGITAGISYNTGQYKEYTNTPVQGNLVGFVAEGYRGGSGKSYTEHHYTYVEYEINGNRMLFRSGPGITYPKIAVFYQN